ncbi:helix-turn-helix transcriptional regulator [Sporosarcina sp.]|uniref:helix-turn-helix domain-containing protein n=1 Tax=Sporosarcina sp. TaxID=49982 RepID=UPI002607BDBD|nr:helix-turn-helix transcriptional regulator [Sporosarcina sp.]
MQLTSWTIEEKLQNTLHFQTQEEQICYILSSFEEIFSFEKISFYRFSPIGYVAEGVAQLENGNFRTISYIRDDIRSLPIIKRVVAERKACCYSGQDIITLISSRYNRDLPLQALIVVPIFVNNLTIGYILSEYIHHIPQVDGQAIELLTLFGGIAGRVLIQPQKISHPKLSPRENEILRAIANGLSTKELTDILALSEATIKQYIKSSFVKLGAKNRAHAVSIYLAPRI